MGKQIKLALIFCGFALLAHLPWLVDGVLLTQNDMIQQQLPFYLDGWEKFHQGSLPMWGFNNLLGINYLGANSFYFAFSPFFLVSLLFPKALLPTVMFGLNILKLALAGMTMSWFLQSLKVKSFWLLVLGGLSYAFSGPLIMNYWFNHFNDFLCLVPLFFIAMEWVIQKRRYWPMSLAVALAVTINLYFCFGLSLLSFSYFCVRTALLAKQPYFFDFRRWIQQIAAYLGLYALGLALAAFAFFPTVHVLLGNPRLNDALAKTPSWQQLLTNWLMLWQSLLLPPVTMKIHPFLAQSQFGRSGMWQSLTATLAPVIFLAFGQMHQVWSKHVRIIVLVAIGSSLAIFAWPLTNQILAGFSNITFRNLYLVAFLVLTFAIVTYDRLERQKSVPTFAITFGLLTLLVVSGCVAWYQLPVDQPVIDTFWRVVIWSIIPLGFVVVITGGIMIVRPKRQWQWLALLVGCFGCFQFSYFIYWSGNQQPSFVAASQVDAIMERTVAYADVQAGLGSDEILWRFASDFTNEKTDYFAYNQGLAYQLNTPHIYHSLYQTSTHELFNFLHGIEQEVDAYWQRYWVRSFKYNRLTHWLLGVKYTILSNESQQPLPTASFVDSTAIGELYQLPSQFAKTYRYYVPTAELAQIPWVMRDLVANEAFLAPEPEIQASLPTYPWREQVEVATQQLTEFVQQSPNLTIEQGVLHVAVDSFLTIPCDNQSGEWYVSNLPGMTVYIDGQAYDTKNDTAHYMQAKTLAIPVTPTMREITLQLPSGYYPLWQNTVNSFQLFFADAKTFHPALVPQSSPIYQGNMWQQQVTITESQTLVFPVAFDSGWSVQINQGHKQVVKSIQGGLIGVTLPPGTHDLVFTYETPGLRFGTSVTVVSSCSLIGIIIWRKQVQKRQRGGYQW